MTRQGQPSAPWEARRPASQRFEPPRGSLCGLDHRGEPGSFDESARRLSHEELFVALELVEEGHAVRSSRERASSRTADLDVCGMPVEIKSWQPLAQRSGRRPAPESVFNKLRQAEGQSPYVVLLANGSGLTRSAALRGMRLYAATVPAPPLREVRVIGDAFRLTWYVDSARVLDGLPSRHRMTRQQLEL